MRPLWQWLMYGNKIMIDSISKGRNNSFFLILIFTILFVVPALAYFKILPSIGRGLSITLILSSILIVRYLIIPRNSITQIISLIMLYAIIHASLNIFSYVNQLKFAISFIAFVCMYLISIIISKNIIKINIDTMKVYTKYALFFIYVLLAIDIIIIDGVYEKSMFPNSEYSHFYLNYAVLFLLSLFFFRPLYVLIIYGSTLMYAPSLTGLSIFILFLVLLSKIDKQLSLLFLFFILLSLLLIVNINYYSDRLINIESNLSALVYLQGLSFIIDTLYYNPFGLGFQQMNCDMNIVINYFTERITSLYGFETYMCLSGGFNLSKIIVEFGLFGIVIVLFYFKYAIKNLVILRQRISDKVVTHDSIFRAMTIPYLIDIFVRGHGYFSISFIFLLIGATGLSYIRCRNIMNRSAMISND